MTKDIRHLNTLSSKIVNQGPPAFAREEVASYGSAGQPASAPRTARLIQRKAKAVAPELQRRRTFP